MEEHNTGDESDRQICNKEGITKEVGRKMKWWSTERRKIGLGKLNEKKKKSYNRSDRQTDINGQR